MKQINIKTMKTIVLGSLKCPTGRETDLLNQMPKLARNLVQSPKHQTLMRQLIGD
jgi:hypothetical protein